MKTLDYLQQYVRGRPLFLSVLRAKESALYQQYLPFYGKTLDYGCGDGFFARIAFGSRGIDVGLDMGESRIDEAKASGAYKKLVTYDGKKIPFPSRSFDIVVSNSVLEHVDGLSGAVSEIYRVLKPGGVFITTVMAQQWEENLFGSKIIGDSYKEYMRKKQVHLNLFTYTQWRGVFIKSGFSVKKVVGHVSPAACTLLDVLHYVSIPSLVSYMMFHRWVIFPMLTKFYPLSWLAKQIEPNVKPEHSGALFFVLTKSH